MIYLLIQIIDAVFTVLFWLIFAHIILSWIPKTNETIYRISQAVDTIINPIFRPLRKIVPVIDLGGMGFDLTPIVTIILLSFIHRVINTILGQLL